MTLQNLQNTNSKDEHKPDLLSRWNLELFQDRHRRDQDANVAGNVERGIGEPKGHCTYTMSIEGLVPKICNWCALKGLAEESIGSLDADDAYEYPADTSDFFFNKYPQVLQKY